MIDVVIYVAWFCGKLCCDGKRILHLFSDHRYTKVQPPGCKVPILQVHLKIFVYKYMTPGMWSATAHSGLLDSVPALDKKDDECCSHPDLVASDPSDSKKA